MSQGQYQPVRPDKRSEGAAFHMDYVLFALACLTVIATTVMFMLQIETGARGIDYGTYVLEEVTATMRSEASR